MGCIPKSEKGNNSVTSDRKGNQVIYIMDPNCMPYIIILAQSIRQIFCSQCSLWVKCLSLKRGIIQSNFDRIL